MLENKLITDLLPLINGFNNHVTIELTYSSRAYSTNDEIHENNVSANRTGTKKGNVWRSQDGLCLVSSSVRIPQMAPNHFGLICH